MAGLVYDVGRHLYQNKSSYRNTSARHHVDSERYIVEDEAGLTECNDPDLLWGNTNTYVWVDYYMIDNVMVYLFEFSG
jgi:hypothetical protein